MVASLAWASANFCWYSWPWHQPLFQLVGKGLHLGLGLLPLGQHQHELLAVDVAELRGLGQQVRGGEQGKGQ